MNGKKAKAVRVFLRVAYEGGPEVSAIKKRQKYKRLKRAAQHESLLPHPVREILHWHHATNPRNPQ